MYGYGRANEPGVLEWDPGPVLRRVAPHDGQVPGGQHVALGAGLPVQPHALHHRELNSLAIEKI